MKGNAVGKREFLKELESAGIRPRHAIGQNYLWDRALLKRLLEEAEVYPLHAVLEIGPGAGSLTKILAESAEKLIAVEIDPQTRPLLEALEEDYPVLDVMYEDALQLDLGRLFTPEEKEELQIIANLPYYLTTELIRHCILSLPEAKAMHFMVQKEVLPRLSGTAGDGKSQSKNKGSLSVLIAAYGELRAHRVVKAGAFYPAPRVDSRFVSLIKKAKPGVSEVLEKAPEKLDAVIRQAFSVRRKTLLNAFPDKNDKMRLKKWLKAENLPLNVRAEQLAPAEFAALTRVLCL